MSDLEFMCGICQRVLSPFTEAEKAEVMEREYRLAQMNPEEQEEEEESWGDNFLPAEEENPYEETEEGYWQHRGYNQNGEPIYKFHRWGF